MALVACAGDRTSHSTEQTIDDNVIAAQVKTALVADPDVKGMKIDVDVSRGVVQLQGVAESAANARKAVTIARNVERAREVRHNLLVQ